jgi:SOS response regulatory protein OraA/RecX
MKPAFTSQQEMYNYAANQMMNQELSHDTVKQNLMERGVTDADAEIVIQNMLVAIEKRKKAEEGTKGADTNTAAQAFASLQKKAAPKNNYGSFATMQEMYDFAANQLVVEKLSQLTVRRNLVNKGVGDSEADSVIENMMVQIQKNGPAETSAATTAAGTPVATSTGSFASVQEMYNYAADQLIVKKLSQQTTKTNLMNHGLSSPDADVVIKTMMDQIEKNKPAQANAKRSEGKRMMLVGLIIGGIGALLYGTPFTIADQSFQISYGILAVGAIFFFKGLFKMF